MPLGRHLHVVALIYSVLACGGDGATRPRSESTPVVTQLRAASDTVQVAAVGTAANHVPSVLATAADGSPVKGALVRFEFMDASAGTVSVATNAAGIASLPTWVLPNEPRVARVEARYGSLSPVVFSADVRVRDYDLKIRIVGGDVGASGQRAIAAAEALVESIIFGDLPDEELDGLQPQCSVGGPPNPTLTETVDDLLVLLRVRDIDGLGRSGGVASPCLIRDPGAQPIVSIVELDSAEWVSSSESEQRNMVLHELIHALGFAQGLLTRTLPSGFTRHCLELPSRAAPNQLIQDTHFSCTNARQAFDRLGGISYAGSKVPLENGGFIPGTTAGSLNNHWREISFGRELMSAFYQVGSAPLSLVTVAALEDLGYQVTYAAAEPFSFAIPIASRPGAVWEAPRVLDADVAPPPVEALRRTIRRR